MESIVHFTSEAPFVERSQSVTYEVQCHLGCCLYRQLIKEQSYCVGKELRVIADPSFQYEGAPITPNHSNQEKWLHGRSCASGAKPLYKITWHHLLNYSAITPTPMVEFKTKYQRPQIDMEGKCFSKPTSIHQHRRLVKKCSMRYSMIVLAGGKREFRGYCLSIPLTHHNKSAEGKHWLTCSFHRKSV